jgi:5-methylcytosine-specific restriction endonuclease McrA
VLSLRALVFGPFLAIPFRLIRPCHVNRGDFWRSYSAYLRSEQWQKRRRFVILRDGRCRDCGAQGTDVHHLTYGRVGRERLSDLVLLCERCHKMKKVERKWSKLLSSL